MTSKSLRASRRVLTERIADRLAGHPLGRWSLARAVDASAADSSYKSVRTAALHVRSAFVRNPQLAVARTAWGTEMVVDLSDWRHHELLARGVYEPHITRLLEQVAFPGWTVIDVGANVGYFAALASHLGGADATVHAFEPHPRMAALAQINARMNEGVSYTVVQAACGAQEERRDLHLARVPGNIGDSTLLAQPSDTGPTIDVDVARLDDYCQSRDLKPDVIKIDVEGFEQQVLKGMARLLVETIPPILIVELGGEPERPAAAAAIAVLNGYGYVARSITPSGDLADYVEQPAIHDVCFVHQRDGSASADVRQT